MFGRVVEIARDGVHLSLRRGFMIVSSEGEEVGRVAVGDLGALIVRGHGASVSLNLCSKLAEEGLPIVLCGSNQSPNSLVWPVQGHFEQGRRMQAQAEATRPTRKRLWRDLVAAKIAAQAGVLDRLGKPDARLVRLSKSVKSGDPENFEGQAARRYWPRLMGDDFRRDRSAGGLNGCLNYAYTVLRAGTARSILGAGLHPSLSVHHESRGDALRLADDLMEPFRPYMDEVVARLPDTEKETLSREGKASLAKALTLDLEGPDGARPVQACLDALALSLARVYLGSAKVLELPGPPLPLIAAGSSATHP